MRLLLVEDNPALADVICRALQQSGYVVDWAQDGRTADAWLGVQQYAAVLLDLGLPDGDGGEVLRRMRAAGKAIPTLVLSAREAVDERVRLLDLGADDYVVKPIALNELEARIRSLIRRSHGIAEAEIRLADLCLYTATRTATVGAQAVELNPREWAALHYLAIRAPRIVTKEQLLQALYGWHEEVSSINAVEKIISRLRQKLDTSQVLIRTVRGLGYYVVADDAA